MSKWKRMRTELLEDSPLESEAAKVALVDALIGVLRSLEHKTEKLLADEMSSDEFRGYPGLNQRAQKFFEMLGLTRIEEEEEDEL